MEQMILSSKPFLVSLLALLPLLIFAVIKQKIKSRKLKLPPSPARLPLIGNLHQVGKLPHKSLHELSRKHGPIMFIDLGKNRCYVISSADALEEITKNYEMELLDRPPLSGQAPLRGNGQDVLYHPYGDHWKQVRKISALHQMSKNMVDRFQTIRDEEISSMCETIHGASLKGEEIDMSDMFNIVMANVVRRTFTGSYERGESKQLESATRSLLEWDTKFKKLSASFSFSDYFPCFAWIDRFTGFTTNLKRTHLELDGLMKKFISERKNESFVDVLLQNDKLDEKAIIQQNIIAAVETTQLELEWILSEIIKHPQVLKKAQEEVQRVVGTKSKISHNEINQMQYLRCIIKESLRLHPPAMIPRTTSTKWVSVGGYDIPPKTKVLVNIFAIQRDPKYWDKPDEFIPERFMENNIEYMGNKAFVPFGFGRRNCPGMAYGSALLEEIIANLLYRFHWKMPNDSRPEELNMEELTQFIVGRKHPLRLVPVLNE